MDSLKECGHKKIIFYPPVEWGGLFQRPHHIAFQMAGLFDEILFVQPAGLRNPSWKDIGRLRGIIGPARDRLSGQILGHDRLKICWLPFLPFHGLEALEAFNAWVFSRFVRRSVSSSQATILWIGAPAPFLRRALRSISPDMLVFDWMDDYCLFSHLPPVVHDMQYWLVQKADLVFASSSTLLNKARQMRRDGLWLLPNGVDMAHWDPDKNQGGLARYGRGKSLIGYFGAISHWLDGDLVSDLAKRHREWDFVFIGPRTDNGSLDPMFSLPNCHHVSAQPYDKLPTLASGFDVCWIPFKMGGLMNSINPVKAYEYLAMGKPVVSIPFPDLGGLEHVITFATDGSSFEKAITEALKWGNQPFLADKRRNSVRPFTWERIGRRAATILEDAWEDQHALPL